MSMASGSKTGTIALRFDLVGANPIARDRS